MPDIVVFGTPPPKKGKSQEEQEKLDKKHEEFLEKVMELMVERTRTASGIDYQETEVKVWFPSDRMQKGLGNEFSIHISCLDSKEVRDESASNDIASTFCNVVASFFPDFWDIECEVRPFKQHAAGYEHWNKVLTTKGG